MEIKPHPLFSEEEARELQAVRLQSVKKTYAQADKKLSQIIIEYDQQTWEFVGYDPDQVEVPVKVNGENLSEMQKKAFQIGSLVELEDGTRIQHSATDSRGIRSDRKALILSVLLDGGISYVLLRGIRNQAGNHDEQKEGYTKGYNQVLADSMVGKPKREAEMTVGEHFDHSRSSQHSRGYGRTASR